MYLKNEQNGTLIDEYNLNDRQLLALTKIATFGVITTQMIALYFAYYYPEIIDKYVASKNTIRQLISKNLIKKVSVGFGEYRSVFVLKNKGKLLTEDLKIYYIKSSQKIYRSGFRHQIITNHISIFMELLLKEKIVRSIHENQIRKMKIENKWNSRSVPDFLFTTTAQKMILVEYEKNLKNEPRKLVEKLIGYRPENLKSIKEGIDKIYYFVGSEKKKENLTKYFLKADETANEYIDGYATYILNRSKVVIKSIEETQNIFLKKFNCEELRSFEILM